MSRHDVAMVLFDGFELLDVFGPLEVFGMADDLFTVTLIGPTAGPVASSQGTQEIADVSYSEAACPDVVIVPGGAGTRTLVNDGAWLAWLQTWASSARLVTGVCTGAALLAAAGLLDGHRATSNRRAFDWVRRFGTSVTWVEDARWVEDSDRWTSAGVSAGIDMALGLVASLHGDAAALEIAERMEYNQPAGSPLDHEI